VNDALAAAQITVEGRVQGVGFRDYTQRRATDLGLSGYVLNLADGRVQVHAEGPRPAIEALARDLERGPRAARVARVAVAWGEASGRHARFAIVGGEPGP
jgi:acylphosphatase